MSIGDVSTWVGTCWTENNEVIHADFVTKPAILVLVLCVFIAEIYTHVPKAPTFRLDLELILNSGYKFESQRRL